MRAPKAAVAGTTVVKLSLEGWPGVKTESAEFEVPVLVRKKVYQAKVSPRQRTAWPVGERWSVRQMVVSPDGREVSVLCSTRAEFGEGTKYYADLYRLCRWEITDGQARQVLDVSVDKVLDLNAERDQFLARKPRFRFANAMPTISDAKCSADGRLVIVTTRLPEEWRETEQGQEVQSWAGRVALLDARTGAVSQQLETVGLPYHLPCFSPDGRIAAAVRASEFVSRAEAKTRQEKRVGQVRLWDVASGRVQTTLQLNPGETAGGIIFSPNGKTLAISYWATDPSTKTQRNMVKLWDVAKNQTLAELPNRYDVRFVAGGRYLLGQRFVGQRQKDLQGQVLLYDRDTKGDRRVFTYDASLQVHVLGAADSRFLLCCFRDGRVVKLDLPSGNVVAEQKATTNNHGFYNDWALSGDGRFLAGNACTLPPFRVGRNLPEDWEEVPPPEITIWDTSKLIRLETLTGHEGSNNPMTFAVGGSWLLSAGGRPEGTKPMLRLWDLRNVDRQPSVQVVKYDALQDTIKQFRGKVVVVDYWADFCIICKQEFPHLVQMQRKYADDLAAVSVSLDDPSDEEAIDRAQRFLKAKNATFTNLILDEKPEFWQKKLGFDGPPAVFVYDRRGELKKVFKGAFTYEDIERLVKELTAKKE